MIFDTDIIIWIQRGNVKAAKRVDSARERFISVLSYMELLQKAENRKQHSTIRSFLRELEFSVLPLTEKVGHRALIYVEEYTLSHGISANDAIIAATAVENAQALISSNAKHYRPIKDLDFRVFRP